jgi:hypothetical protein
MTVLSEDEIGRRCTAGAVVLCIVHILTIVGTDYQVYAKRDSWLLDRFYIEDLLPSLFGFFVNYGIFLSPVIILILFRRFCIFVGIMALPVLIFFTLRMHHVWQFYWFGINSMARQKGDELGWATLLFELLSAAVAAPVLLFIVAYKLIDRVRAWRG